MINLPLTRFHVALFVFVVKNSFVKLKCKRIFTVIAEKYPR